MHFLFYKLNHFNSVKFSVSFTMVSLHFGFILLGKWRYKSSFCDLDCTQESFRDMRAKDKCSESR